MSRWIIGLVCVVAWPVLAQTPEAPASPVQAPLVRASAPAPLTPVQRLEIVNAAHAVEIWRLRVQAAQGQEQQALSGLQKLMAAAQVPGWRLNETLDYVRIEEPIP